MRTRAYAPSYMKRITPILMQPICISLYKSLHTSCQTEAETHSLGIYAIERKLSTSVSLYNVINEHISDMAMFTVDLL
jgi:hypothetical protein